MTHRTKYLMSHRCMMTQRASSIIALAQQSGCHRISIGRRWWVEGEWGVTSWIFLNDWNHYCSVAKRFKIVITIWLPEVVYRGAVKRRKVSSLVGLRLNFSESAAIYISWRPSECSAAMKINRDLHCIICDYVESALVLQASALRCPRAIKRAWVRGRRDVRLRCLVSARARDRN